MTQQQQQQYGPMPPYPPPPPPEQKSHGCLYAILGGVAAIVIILIVVFVILANAGQHVSTTQPSAKPASSAPGSSAAPSGPQKLAVGQPVRISGGISGGAANVTITSATTGTQPQSSYGQAPQNGQFVFAHVSVNNVTGGGFDINPLYFYAVSSSGGHYDAMSGNAMMALDNQATASTVNPGENWSGSVAFDVPAGHGYVVYAPQLNSRPLAEWPY